MWPQEPTSGQAREEQAKKVAHIIAAIYSAEARIYRALARAAARVIRGAIRETLARCMLEQAVRRILADADAQVRRVLDAADRATPRRYPTDHAERPPRRQAPGGIRRRRQWRRPVRPSSSVAGRFRRRDPEEAARAVQEALGLPEPPSWDTAVRLHQAGLTALRSTDDVFRDVIAEAMAYHTAIGSRVRDLRGRERAEQSLSRLQVAQKALDLFAERGVTGFVDGRGRRWDLASYAEMATRTAATA